jgi:serine/threonine-protein kinase
MATVLLAEDERLGRKVAVKRLHAEMPEDTERRFRREARLQASLNHPNLVAIYDTHTDDEGVLIVMEHVDGETLSEALKRGPLEPERAIEVLRGLAGALDHAHEEGIVHRDVKPANVLLGSDGRVKLADLGIATAVEGTRITMSGTVLGTAAYMAPEALEGHSPGPAADVYSLAVVAWESLSGRRAYEGRTPLQIAHRKAAEAPPSLTDAWPQAPAAAAAVLARGMDPDPSQRPATPGALVSELAEALGQRERAEMPRRTPAAPAPLPRNDAPARAAAPAPTPTPPLAPPTYARHESGRPRRRSWLVPVVALVAVIGVAAALLFALDGGGSDSSNSKSSSAADSAAAQKRAERRRARANDQAPSAASPAPTTEQQPQPDEQQPADTTPGTGTGSSSSYEVPQPTGSDPKGAAQLNQQGKSMSDAGKYEQAIPVLEQAVRASSADSGDLTYAFALFNLGHALNAGGRPEDAIPVLEQRLEIPNQRSTVQRELDSARAAAGSG